MIRTLIVDDERLARARLRRLLRGDPEIHVLAECANGAEAAPHLPTADLVFLDIQMPGMDGFALVQSQSAKRGAAAVLVFVTAHDEYALKAFEARAFDYLLKPFSRSRFQDVLTRAKAQVQLAASRPSPAAPPPVRLLARDGKRLVFVAVESIDWIEAAGNYACLHCAGATHVIRETMQSLEQKLDPAKFRRIHRSTIVNLDRVAELEPWFGGDYRVRLHGGRELTWSRTYRP